MRVTKYEHAALVIEKDGSSLVIDPGSWTKPLTDLTNVVGTVVTHEHADHWNADHLNRILGDFPDTPIFGPEGFAKAADGLPIVTVHPGTEVTVDPFTLRFFGGKHAVIHPSIPLVDNVGVLVDNRFYYGGDSYAIPDGVDVELLAVPLGAPWLRIGDAMDFTIAVDPRAAFGTHDAPLSDIGRGMGHRFITMAVKKGGGEYHALEPGDSITL